MSPAKLRSHLYLKAVDWIAKEDPQARSELDALPLVQSAVVRLTAHLWGRPANLVARDVIHRRGTMGNP
jgi:hypothetical protein